MTYVVGTDVGTTRMRCFLVDHDGKTLTSHYLPVNVLHPKAGHAEMDPEEFWLGFKDLVTQTISRAGLDVKDAKCLGITCQRNTFLLWHRETGRPLCNMITWQDRRASQTCKDWNASLQFKFLHTGASLLHFVTGSKRFLAASILLLITQQVAPRLYWALNNYPNALDLALAGKVCFGTIDTWLLWKLTGGKVHATDYSNISTSALFDPYQMQYSDLVLSTLGIPASILPNVKDTGGLFGHTDEDIFGAEIPITAIVSDQTSAMFAQGCWSPGDVKCTLGTGMFLSFNTGRKAHASLTGFYPEIGWKIGEELVYLAEANFPSCGSVIQWGLNFGLYSDPSQTAGIAEMVESSDGLCFVPAFDGIQVPHNDPTAAAGMIGLTHNTRKEHMVRALLESIAYNFKQVFEAGKSELNLEVNRIRVDGGVCNNDFVMQLTSNIIGHTIERPAESDITVYGAVFIAGLACGFWESKDEIKRFWKLDRTFDPVVDASGKGVMLDRYRNWQRALERCLSWYPSSEQHKKA